MPGAGDGNRTRMASLEGLGLEAPPSLVSAMSAGCRAFHVPPRHLEDVADVGVRVLAAVEGDGRVCVRRSAGPVEGRRASHSCPGGARRVVDAGRSGYAAPILEPHGLRWAVRLHLFGLR